MRGIRPLLLVFAALMLLPASQCATARIDGELREVHKDLSAINARIAELEVLESPTVEDSAELVDLRARAKTLTTKEAQLEAEKKELEDRVAGGGNAASILLIGLGIIFGIPFLVAAGSAVSKLTKSSDT